MKTAEVTVNIPAGLDGHGIAMCVQTASQFASTVRLTDGTRSMNAKSIMGMMAMGLAIGDMVTVEADGPDEEAALQAMASFFEGK